MPPYAGSAGTQVAVQLPYDCRVVVLADSPRGVANIRNLRRPRLFVAVLLTCDALILGCLGWVLPSPGGSLVIPTLIVFGIGCLVAVALWIATGGRAVVVSLIGIAGVASLWTFAFSLPASLAWNSGATVQALAALSRPNPPTTNPADESYLPCSVVRSGAVGPLDAPYQVCVTSFNSVHIVSFKTLGSPYRGLTYTDVGASSFPDECSRHLIGMWWMFVGDTGRIGNCPFGYQFHGGG